jgi:hypothetical protein
MAQFKAFAPGVKVNGQTVLSAVAAMKVFKDVALQVLAENGISDPKPGQWYPQQSWLNALKVIAESVGESTIGQIGKRTLENADWPPGTNSIEKALASIEVAYHMNHRGDKTGRYNFEKTGDRSAKVICNNPYPCDFDRGIIEAIAKEFGPRDSLVAVKHDDSQACRKKGADSCTYLISWRELWGL